jgi:hypothetical protein
MPAVKKNTKAHRKFGSGRSKRKRGRKKNVISTAVVRKTGADTRRAKCTVVQKERLAARASGSSDATAMEAVEAGSSTSTEVVKVRFTKKLEHLANISGVHSPMEHSDPDAPQYGFADVRCINEMLVKAPEKCPDCDSTRKEFIHESGDDLGFAMRLYVVCGDCECTLGKGFSSRRIEGPNSAFDVNKRAVFAMRSIGCSYSDIDRFSIYMNMPGSMHHTTHITAVNKIEKELMDTIVETLRYWGDAAKKAREDEPPSDSGRLEICVSYDGTWQKRVRGSKIGVGFVIDSLTGLVLDFEVLCTHCFGCKFAPDKEAVDEDGENLYDQWFERHDEVCTKNFDGSAQAMEQQLALHIWERSIKLHDLVYNQFLGDGDSKTCDKLNSEEVYGPDVRIEKVDCINHVSKRIGTALRDFAETTPAAKLPDKGRFQKEVIPKLQNYYGKAIKTNHESVENMYNAIWASFYYMASTDKKPDHKRCPTGEKSWCFFQRAIAKGEKPASHVNHTHIPPVVAKGIKSIYERMSDRDLLKRCLMGKTTNPNEAIHNVLWDMCPKEKFVSLAQVRIAAINTIHLWNEGHIGYARHMSSLKLPITPTAAGRMQKLDATKEQRLIEKMSKKGRKARAQRKLDKGKTQKQKEKWEGTVYGYGLDGKEKK